MVDRVRANNGQGNGKSSKLICPSTYNPTGGFTGFLADLIAGNVYVDINANNSDGENAGVDVIGDPINKATFLQDTTAGRFSGDATSKPNDIYNLIADQLWWNEQMDEVEFLASDWVGSSAPYTQEKTVTNAKARSNPAWDLYIPSGTTTADAVDMIDACSLINKLETADGKIIATCYQAKPSKTFKIKVKGAYGSWITNQ